MHIMLRQSAPPGSACIAIDYDPLPRKEFFRTEKKLFPELPGRCGRRAELPNDGMSGLTTREARCRHTLQRYPEPKILWHGTSCCPCNFTRHVACDSVEKQHQCSVSPMSIGEINACTNLSSPDVPHSQIANCFRSFMNLLLLLRKGVSCRNGARNLFHSHNPALVNRRRLPYHGVQPVRLSQITRRPSCTAARHALLYTMH